MPVVLTEYQSGFQHAVDEAEHMLTIDVVHSIASFRFDPADTDYQRGFLEGMEQYYQSLGKV
tara:strand:+ start:2541 stop:2726 length:186 start_codon:yes stop_codon:yes gene_type:complete